MHLAIVQLESVTPYSPSRMYAAEVPKLAEESAEEYDQRTWRNHAHVNEGKHIVIPGQCFAWCVKDAAQKRADRIPGKGQKTFTACFDSLEVRGDVDTGVQVEKAPMICINAHADGNRKSGKRVPRRFPIISSWNGKLEFLIWDDVLTEDVFAKTLRDAGILIGVGRYRPQKRGTNGRFLVKSIEWRSRVDPMEVFAAAAE